MKKTKHLILRGSTYYLRRRVNERYRAVEPRSEVWISLGTDSLKQASEKAVQVWENLIAGWEARLSNRNTDALKHFSAVQELAKAKGVKYLPIPQVAELPVTELLDRIEAIGTSNGKPDHIDAKALLGGVAAPQLSVSETLEEYWELAEDKVLKKSPDQLRRWRNPRIKAVRNFIHVVGDKPIDAITRDDLLDFRKWWVFRVTFEGRNPSTANKDFIHLGSVLKTVNEMKRLNINLPLGGLNLREEKQTPRPKFSIDWIRSKLLAPGALNELEPQAKGIFLAMINTGARPSELANLMPSHIILDHQYPHIVITTDGRKDNRELKTDNAARVIPLVGISLEAMKDFPDGFPLYHDNPALSDVVNAYLTKHELRETPKHVVYSLRHSFEDRLRKAKVTERIRVELFGHTYFRERYGEPELDELTEAIQLIAL